MAWDIEYTNEFGDWWETLTEACQDDVDIIVALLQERGPHLEFPCSSGITGSRRAMGGEPEIIARFPDGSVQINQFEELGANQP